jgi:hypothetical protein
MLRAVVRPLLSSSTLEEQCFVIPARSKKIAIETTLTADNLKQIVGVSTDLISSWSLFLFERYLEVSTASARVGQRFE